MHDGMQYDTIRDQGHEPFKVGNPAIFKNCLFRHLQLTTDSLTRAQYLILFVPNF